MVVRFPWCTSREWSRECFQPEPRNAKGRFTTWRGSLDYVRVYNAFRRRYPEPSHILGMGDLRVPSVFVQVWVKQHHGPLCVHPCAFPSNLRSLGGWAAAWCEHAKWEPLQAYLHEP